MRWPELLFGCSGGKAMVVHVLGIKMLIEVPHQYESDMAWVVYGPCHLVFDQTPYPFAAVHLGGCGGGRMFLDCSQRPILELRL